MVATVMVHSCELHSHLLERGRFQLLRPEMSSRKWLAFLFIPLEGPARPTVLCFHLDLLKFPH